MPTFTKELRLDPRRAPGSEEPQHRWKERLTWVIRDAAEGRHLNQTKCGTRKDKSAG